MTASDSQHDDGGVIYLVEEQANPSSDYFVLPALQAGAGRVVRCGFADVPSAAELHGAVVVFVRYVPVAWVRAVAAARAHIRQVVFFMDDDVLDVHASAGMPLRYRFKLARLAAWRRGWLQRQRAQLWVSTPYLQEKYAAWGARLVPPSPLATAQDFRRVFYHGTASHGAEIRWLRPVLEEVVRRDARVAVEIVGGRDVYRAYRGMPCVTVVHPMQWPAYQATLALPGRHVGLAPLLDLPFNRARSCTKFFDVTRCGAVGVYAAEGACAAAVRDGVDGLLVAMDEAAWVDAILRLVADEPLRQGMLDNARLRVDALAARARESCRDLLGS